MEIDSKNGIKRQRIQMEIISIIDNIGSNNNSVIEPIPEDYKIENLLPGVEMINFINNNLARKGHSCGILRDNLAWCGREKCIFSN